MVTEKAKHLFESNGVYTHQELEARHEIELEKYTKKVQIESRIDLPGLNDCIIHSKRIVFGRTRIVKRPNKNP
jgi:glutamine synthetase type III